MVGGIFPKNLCKSLSINTWHWRLYLSTWKRGAHENPKGWWIDTIFLGFNWHPFEGAGRWEIEIASEELTYLPTKQGTF